MTVTRIKVKKRKRMFSCFYNSDTKLGIECQGYVIRITASLTNITDCAVAMCVPVQE
jgi:hypothetical protein